MTPSFTRPRPIKPDDELSRFDCGKPSLNEYLTKRAVWNNAEGGSRCIVSMSDGRVAGYYALATSTISHLDVVGRVRRNMPDPIPMVLLSRLAVDLKFAGRGLGRQLLRDAILRTVEVAQIVGVRGLLVHALDEEARAFYEKFDFEASVTDPLHLMLLVKDMVAVYHPEDSYRGLSVTG